MNHCDGNNESQTNLGTLLQLAPILGLVVTSSCVILILCGFVVFTTGRFMLSLASLILALLF